MRVEAYAKQSCIRFVVDQQEVSEDFENFASMHWAWLLAWNAGQRIHKNGDGSSGLAALLK